MFVIELFWGDRFENYELKSTSSYSFLSFFAMGMKFPSMACSISIVSKRKLLTAPIFPETRLDELNIEIPVSIFIPIITRNSSYLRTHAFFIFPRNGPDIQNIKRKTRTKNMVGTKLFISPITWKSFLDISRSSSIIDYYLKQDIGYLGQETAKKSWINCSLVSMG